MAKGDRRRREEERREDEAENTAEDSKGVVVRDEGDEDWDTDDTVDEADAAPDPLPDPTPEPEQSSDSSVAVTGDADAPTEEDGTNINFGDGSVGAGDDAGGGDVVHEDNSINDSLNEDTDNGDITHTEIDDGSQPPLDPQGAGLSMPDPVDVNGELVPDPGSVDPDQPTGEDDPGPTGTPGDDTPEPPGGPGNIHFPGGFGEGENGPVEVQAASFGTGANGGGPPAESATYQADVVDAPAAETSPPVFEEILVEEAAPVDIDLVEQVDVLTDDGAADELELME